MAPEILTGTPYDESADMWSVGVILYILLGGYPPFIDDNQRKLFRKIRKGEYEFHEEYWGPVSEDAKNLISNLLCVKASRRLTAREALQSNWIAKATDESLEKNDMGANLIEMRKFNGKRKFVSLFVHILCLFCFMPICRLDMFNYSLYLFIKHSVRRLQVLWRLISSKTSWPLIHFNRGICYWRIGHKWLSGGLCFWFRAY